MKKKNLPEVENFSELVGEFIEYWGFKKIHGKIWVHIYLSHQPIDAKELMARLGISKALVSITLKDLLEYEVVMEDQLSAEGTRTYRANKDIRYVVQRVLRAREKILMGKVKSSVAELKNISTQDMDQHNIHPASLRELDKLISNGDKILSTIMKLI